jgi:hypothetical protein
MNNDKQPDGMADDFQNERRALEAIQKAEGPLGRQFETWVIETRSVRGKKQADGARREVGWWTEKGRLICPYCLQSSPWPSGLLGEACCPHCEETFSVRDHGPRCSLRGDIPPLSQRDRDLLQRCTTVLVAILLFIMVFSILISVPPLDRVWVYQRGFWAGFNNWYTNPYEGANGELWRDGWKAGHVDDTNTPQPDRDR